MIEAIEVLKSIPEPLDQVWVIGGVSVVAMRAVVVAITIVVVTVTYFGISRSRYGMALRASIADADTAALMVPTGLRVDQEGVVAPVANDVDEADE